MCVNVNSLSSHSSCGSSAGPVLVACIVCSSSDMCLLPQPEAASRDEVWEGEAAQLREWPTAGVKGEWRSTHPSCFRPLFTHSAAGSKAPSHVWSLALALPGVWGIPTSSPCDCVCIPSTPWAHIKVSLAGTVAPGMSDFKPFQHTRPPFLL